ncbi:hypothetical protein BDV12DRAFT_202538, partial [Aspergillus spectabilis]
MPSPPSAWPELATSREESRNNHQSVLDLNHDARGLIEHLNSQKDLRVPSRIIEFIRNTSGLTERLLSQPSGPKWQDVTRSLQASVQAIQKDLHGLRTATEITPSAKVREFTENLSAAPTPQHFVSSHGSTSSKGVPLSDLQEDREVVVKLGSKEAVTRYRGKTNKQIRDLA